VLLIRRGQAAPPPREIKRKADAAQDSSLRRRALLPSRRSSKQPELFEEPLPPFVEPCLATLTAEVPSGDKWVHEIKWDPPMKNLKPSAPRPTAESQEPCDPERLKVDAYLLST
jgi:hypothetical protein